MTDRLVGYAVGDPGTDGDRVALDGRHRLVRIRDGDRAGEQAVSAWLAGTGDHLQAVVDLGTAPNGDLVVVLAAAPHLLPGLIAAPLRLEPAEAVTVLIPLVEAIARLHGHGVVHGSVGPEAVALTDAGAPVLRFARTARTARTLGDAGFADAVAADTAALLALAARLLPGEQAALDALAHDPGGAGVDALFGLAEPVPVRLDRSLPPPVDAGPPARLLVPLQPPVDPVPDDPPGRLRRAIASAMAAASASVRRVRRRVWFTAGASIAALVAALVLLPGHGVDTHAAGAAPSAVPTVSAAPLPVRSTRAPAAAPTGTPTVAASANVADPVLAARALLAARAGCLARGEPPCLARVEVPGSPVDVLDRAALAAGVDAVPATGRPVLVRRAGATATVRVAGATVLLILEPGGWRLRDVVAPRPPGP